MTDRRTFVRTLGAAALGAGVAGCVGTSSDAGGTDPPTDSPSEDTETVEPTGTTGTETGATDDGDDADVEGNVTSDSSDDLQIVEHNYYTDGEVEGVRGTVENISETTYEYVEVHLSPVNEKYERERFEVDSQESIDTLEPGETWDFDVAIDSEYDFREYEIWVTGQTSI